MSDESPAVKPKPDWFGSILGILVFVGGVALILLVFKLAYDLFTVPPQQALGIVKGQPLDPATTGGNLSALFVKVLLLTAMGLMGSWIASRGIGLYAASRGTRPN